MDPNAALELLREWVAEVFANPTAHTADDNDAAQAFAELDRWLSNRGFLPTAWEGHREG